MEKKQLPVVMALIKNEQGQVLAQVRNHPEFVEKHAKWELTGGKIDFNEAPEQAIVREVREETGLEVEVVSLYPKIYSEHWINQSGDKEWHCILMTYICKIVGGQLHNPPEDPKISELRFLSAEEIESVPWGNHCDQGLAREFINQ